MGRNGKLWTILLAAGDGNRLKELTTDREGNSVPKQYCSFRGDRSLLHWAVDRVRPLVPEDRMVPVVARRHRRWWETQLAGIPRGNIVVQPANRDTAPGILLPLMHILARDPEARILILPTDHFVEREGHVRGTLREATAVLEDGTDPVVLLGITPEHPEPEYGWIVPGDRRGAARGVRFFVEKPHRERAEALMQDGAVWNSFIMAGTGRGFLDLFRKALPNLLLSFQTTLGERLERGGPWVLDALYDILPSWNFSRHVLERTVDRLRVMAIPACGWTDLGTPERIHEYVRTRPSLFGSGERELSWEETADLPRVRVHSLSA